MISLQLGKIEIFLNLDIDNVADFVIFSKIIKTRLIFNEAGNSEIEAAKKAEGLKIPISIVR